MRQTRHVFVAWVGEVAAGELACTLQQVADDSALAEHIPIVESPSKFVNHGCEKQRGIGDAAGDENVCAGVQRVEKRCYSEIRVGGDPGVWVRHFSFKRVDGD